MLDTGQIQHYIDTYSITGLTSNPSILGTAIEAGFYDEAIRAAATPCRSHEDVLVDLAIEDVRRAADLFLPIHEHTDGVDGWVAFDVSPLLAYDTGATIHAAKALYRRAARPNLLVGIPGTKEGLPAVTECVAAGIPVNVTLLFSADHYRAAARAYLNGLQRRISAGRRPTVGSVASVVMSRWDAAVADRVPQQLKDQLALAVGLDIYRAYRRMLDSETMQELQRHGAHPQRLVWASSRTQDPAGSDTFYTHGLAAPLTISAMPEPTLEALYDHGEVGEPMPSDGGSCDVMLNRFADVGVNVVYLAERLQQKGAQDLVASWKKLLSQVGLARTAQSC
jgi:transaldolase